ncbi:hypothetical protein KFK09_027148 [Dendrobium nobile]|uniref:Uncharacterized protein n=1 Tax=Dendrobium nobile TaxID=94219 RepID=A0A8T3AAQ1_DENNO|nr:hypothetical protein KFK09_027148 [Dendrobium nobile]
MEAKPLALGAFLMDSRLGMENLYRSVAELAVPGPDCLSIALYSAWMRGEKGGRWHHSSSTTDIARALLLFRLHNALI